MNILWYCLSAVVGYLLGNISSGVIVSRLFGNVDIRKTGSGNAGTTNVMRTLGWLPSVITLLGDVVKAILAVIIGRDAKNVSMENARNYVFGYTVLNDVTARDLQNRHVQWYFGKSLDGFNPMGPCIVTADEFDFPPALRITSSVNGEVRQDANTNMLIHSIAKIVSQFSLGVTLKAGTIIATGTPKGVAMGMEKPRFLKKGDVVVCEIEGIGRLTNTVV